MQRNWYIICTQKNQEQKVASRLSKKGIESFCPYTTAETNVASRKVSVSAPLFSSYVFVNITPAEMTKVRSTASVVNVLYWKSQPAVISQAEIDAVKMMVSSYSVIKASKITVDTTAVVTIESKNSTSISGNLVSVKHSGSAVTLPSLGYTLISERAVNTNAVAVKKTSFSKTLVKAISPFLIFGF